MQHEFTVSDARDRLDQLFVDLGAEGDDGQSLRLTAGEKAGPVGPGEHADLAGKGADLFRATTIRPQVFLKNILADQLVLKHLVNVRHILGCDLGITLFELGVNRHILD